MMQLLLTVMAIGLAALLVAGGITYFSTDIGVRIEVAHALRAQHDAISAAVSNYRAANNGFVHPDIQRLRPYLPGGELPKFPRQQQPFVWTVLKDNLKYVGLCVNRPAGQETSRSAAEGLVSFVGEMQRKRPGSVTYGVSCDAASTPVDGADPIERDDVMSPGALAVLVRGD